MKPNTLRLVFTLCLSLSLAACSALGKSAGNIPLTASGTIEADLVHLGPEIGGRIVGLPVQRGDSLAAGAEVFRLDDSALQTQLSQAEAAAQAAQAAQAAAKAAQAAAQANLELLQAGATETQIQASQAQLDQAEANRQALQTNLWAMTAASRPEEIAAAQARLNFARTGYFSMTVVLSSTQVEDVHQALTQANGNVSQATERKDRLAADQHTPSSATDMAAITIVDAQTVLDQIAHAYQAVQNTELPFYKQIEAMRTAWSLADLNLVQAKARQTSLETDPDMTQEAKEAARSTVTETQTLLDKCLTAYDGLTTGDRADRLSSAWSNVQTAQDDLNRLGKTAPGGASLESVLSQLEAATAQRNAASANLTNLKNGARQQQVAASQAQVDAAKAQVDATTAQVAAAQAAIALIKVQIGKLTVKAPVAGVVLDRPLNLGEMAMPGATVVELGSLDKVTLTVYIPEDRYGSLQLAQKATIKVDSFPGKTFEGVVEYISDQAEFTPRNVQTVESRSTTVYAIKIGLANPDHSLKPGMPADAEFQANP